MLPPGVVSVADLPGDWWVAHTKSQFEKAFAWQIGSVGIGYYLPMIARTTFSGGRNRHGMYVLFPGYVFMCGDGDVRYRALMTHKLAQVIPVVDGQKLISELTSIERVIRSGLALELYPSAVQGKRRRVMSGPLEGIHGVEMQRENVTRLVVEVSVLGTGASVEIDPDLLEAAE